MFSVIMPLYNKQHTVVDSIRSVLSQSMCDFELIVIDDGSTDKSVERAQGISDSRISVLRKKNGGVSSARNYGIERAKGEYICFLDADDLWYPNHLAALQELISAIPDAGLYATSFRREDTDGSIYIPDIGPERIIEFEDVFKAELEHQSVLNTNSICLPKDQVMKAGGFVEGERIGEDTSLWYRIAAFNKIAMINEVTTVYRLEYSGVISANGALNRSWSFLCFYEEVIQTATEIEQDKKNSIARFVNRYYHSLVRHDLLRGKRNEARDDMKKINESLSSMKENLITRACFFVPRGVLAKLYEKRRRK